MPTVVQIRFTRMGRKKLPFYRIVAVDSRVRRDGAPLEYLGYYDPIKKNANLNAPAIKKWLSGGCCRGVEPAGQGMHLCVQAGAPQGGGITFSWQETLICIWHKGTALGLRHTASACPNSAAACTLLLPAVGAEPSDTVAALLKKAMVIDP